MEKKSFGYSFHIEIYSFVGFEVNFILFGVVAFFLIKRKVAFYFYLHAYIELFAYLLYYDTFLPPHAPSAAHNPPHYVTFHAGNPSPQTHAHTHTHTHTHTS
jgi:hypothetical protein